MRSTAVSTLDVHNTTHEFYLCVRIGVFQPSGHEVHLLRLGIGGDVGVVEPLRGDLDRPSLLPGGQLPRLELEVEPCRSAEEKAKQNISYQQVTSKKLQGNPIDRRR